MLSSQRSSPVSLPVVFPAEPGSEHIIAIFNYLIVIKGHQKEARSDGTRGLAFAFRSPGAMVCGCFRSNHKKQGAMVRCWVPVPSGCLQLLIVRSYIISGSKSYSSQKIAWELILYIVVARLLHAKSTKYIILVW